LAADTFFKPAGGIFCLVPFFATSKDIMETRIDNTNQLD
jgi:hypothetical protein